MIEVSIFSFSIFGEFSELLVNSVLLSAYFPEFQYAESNYFPRIETWKVITFRTFDVGSKTQILCWAQFTNNSLKTPKIWKLNIDTLITPQGLMIHEKNPD